MTTPTLTAFAAPKGEHASFGAARREAAVCEYYGASA